MQCRLVDVPSEVEALDQVFFRVRGAPLKIRTNTFYVLFDAALLGLALALFLKVEDLTGRQAGFGSART